MMPFIRQVLSEILEREKSISDYTFILPSKRSGAYLVHQLSQLVEEPVFSPRILSIEEFVQEVTGLQPVDPITILFEFYRVYTTRTPEKNQEDFETFSSWAQTLLHDFNEIDRHLVNPESFFGYLRSIQETNHWYLQEERTPLMEKYLDFWNRLLDLYKGLVVELERKGMAFQGMVFRKAAEEISDFTSGSSGPFVFVGFNALSKAEQHIFQVLLESGKAEAFWDADRHFLEDQQHDVSLFLRQYLKDWPIYEKKKFRRVCDEFRKPKHIEITGVPRNIGQAKYVGEILSKLSPDELNSTAVVLSDESLLIPVLNSLPPGLGEINITMGFPLRNAPPAFLFERLLKIHSDGNNGKWYYKDILMICSHPLIKEVTKGNAEKILEEINRRNLIHLQLSEILEMSSSTFRPFFNICFGNWKEDPRYAVDQLQELLYLIKERTEKEKNQLRLEFLFQVHLLLNQLNNVLAEYHYIKSIKGILRIFREMLATKKINFQGKPFSGLQLMGVLESRVLDFENIIMTSVNEGVLPGGKSTHSFIPFDLKCTYGLPTYKEKDAIYAYHFYHLLQRSKKAFLLYNTESDGLNAGEKSRFLLQLEYEQFQGHRVKAFQLSPVVPAIKNPLKTVAKTPEILERLKEVAGKGFSPSALTGYIRNPLDFYKQYVLKIKEQEEVEETIAYNTLGNVVHDTLESFYGRWENQDLQVEELEKALNETPLEVEKQFREHYTKAPLLSGQNLLIFEVAKRYVANFITSEIQQLKRGNTIKILKVERNLSCEVQVPQLNFPVRIRGIVDRVDQFNGKLRIIDYKTGRVDQTRVEVVDWHAISSDYKKYSKSFQVLMYTYLINSQEKLDQPAEAGIISFKNLKAGFLKFSKKDKEGRGAKKDSDITQEVLNAFEEQMIGLIEEIFDPAVPFQEKEV